MPSAYEFGQSYFQNDTPLAWPSNPLPKMYTLEPEQSRLQGTCISLLSITLPFVLTYLFNITRNAVIESRQHDGKSMPPMAPYWIPGIGHALSFWTDPTKLALSIKNTYSQSLIRLSFFNQQVTMISGFDAVNAVWKAKELDSKPAVCIAMERFFGTTKKALKFYHSDDSGIGQQPHPMSTVDHAHRVYYHTHKVTQGFMSGPGLPIFGRRFQASLRNQIESAPYGDEWTTIPDIYAFFRDTLSKAAISAMCGDALLELSPFLIDSLWEFDRSLPYFFKGFPSWLAPKAWYHRQRCLDAFKTWQKNAKDNFEEHAIDSEGYDPYYGSPLMRARQEYFSKMEDLDENALASENIGLMWAENANSVPATCWYVLEALKNRELLSRVRDEISEGVRPEGAPLGRFNIEELCSQPLLQSMFAETLRLRTIQFIVRGSDHDDIRINQWSIPKGELVAVDTHSAHTNADVWSTGGPGNPHPIKSFWSDRFLIYPNDPYSGPLRSRAQGANDAKNTDQADLMQGEAKEGKPRFSIGGLSGAWVPFGGGRRQCPGRTFAKQEIILAASMFLTHFDVELVNETLPEPDMRYYGLGGLPPKKAIPCRIRRRAF